MKRLLVFVLMAISTSIAGASLLVDLNFTENSLQNFGSAGETAYMSGGRTPVFADGVATWRAQYDGSAPVVSRALDLNGTTETLDLGSLAIGAGGVKDALNGLTSFTITMWVKGAKLVNAVPVSRYYYNMQLRMDAYARPRAVVNAINSTPNNNCYFAYENEWAFIALAYDGTKTTDNVTIYRNNAISASATLYSVKQTANVGAVNVSDYPITFGAASEVLVDNIKVYGSKTDASGDLGDQIKWVYWGDLHNTEIPEPATILLLGGCGLSLIFRRNK